MGVSSTAKVEADEISEAEFLRQKAEQAKLGFEHSLNRAGVAMVSTVDPRPITRRHPLLAIAAATVTGFVAAAVAVPSKAESALRRTERMHQAMNPQPVTNGKSTDHPPAVHSLWGTILHETIQFIKPVLIAAITAGVKSAASPPPAPPPGTANQSK